VNLISKRCLSVILACVMVQCPLKVLAQDEPVYQETYVIKSNSLLPEYYQPTVLVLPDSTLACAWATGSGPLALDNAINIAFKRVDGMQWTLPVVVADEEGYPDNYPVLSMLPDGGLRLFFSTRYREKRRVFPGEDQAAWQLMYKDSEDAGRIWGKEYFLISESDRIPCSRIVSLSNGDLLLPATNVRDRSSVLLKSNDRGNYWRYYTTAKELSGLVDPVIVELAAGHLLGLLRPYEKGEREKVLWRIESRDYGETWTKPQSAELKNAGSPIALLKLANGHLLLAYNDYESWLMPLTVAISTDGGESWQNNRKIESGRWGRDPSLVQTDDGHIHLIYVSRNIYLKHIEFNESWLLNQKE